MPGRMPAGLRLPMIQAAALGLLLFRPGAAQEPLAIRTGEGIRETGIAVSTERGYSAFLLQDMALLGWEVREGEGEAEIRRGTDGPRVEVFRDLPFLRWDGEGVHLAHPAYRADGGLFVPTQLLIDVLPWKLPEVYGYEAGSWVLEVFPAPDSSLSAPSTPGERAGGVPQPVPSSLPPATSPAPSFRPVSASAGPSPEDLPRVIIIDAGHGGRDPGTVGSRGTREKEVALGISRTLAGLLSREEGLEVHLTREDDTLVPLWRRGERATEWKGERYGVFISIHANALPNSPGTRGFETYFLSEARTEHERRVAALENAAMELEEEEGPPEQVQDLSFILTELRSLDHQHWSALLAEYIQRELADVHPGPDRGVKQGPFAVITNTLMPAVLVEVGFLSNREEERLLTQAGFQEDAARAVADAVLDFLRRYPPRGEGGGRSPLP